MSTDYGRLSKNELAADVGNAIDTLGANNYAQCADIMKFLFDEIPRATAQAVRVDREAIATWHEGQLAALGVRWDQFSTLGMTSAANATLDKAAVYKEAIQAIRSGEHLKGRS